MALSWAAGAGRLTAGGASLEWACWGPPPGQAPVIVMLHEGLGCVALWRDTPAQIAAATGWPVLAYPRAGYGQSDCAELPRPLDYMTCEAIDVLPDVLNTIGADRYVLMGHSDGATIAAEYAGRLCDDRVRGLILMAPHFFAEPMGLAEIERAREAWHTTDLRTRMGKYHANPEVAFCGWNDAWLHPDFRQWHVGGVLDDLQVPALVLQGREDQYGTLAQIHEVETRSKAPVQTLVLAQCRHAPHLDQPDAVITAIVGFCAGLSRMEPT